MVVQLSLSPSPGVMPLCRQGRGRAKPVGSLPCKHGQHGASWNPPAEIAGEDRSEEQAGVRSS